MQHVHQQLARGAVRHLQLVAAVGQEAPLLLGVPVLVGHPARGLGREHDGRPALGLAREDAVAGGQRLVELGIGHVARGLVELARLADAVHREAAQRVAVVVPRIEVPVVAVMSDALRRHPTPGRFVGGAGAVFEGQPLARQHRRGHRAETGLVQRAAAVRDHPHPVHRPVAGPGLRGQQAFDARLQRRQRRGQHAGTGTRQQLLRRQQGIQFFRTQPHAGQFEAVALFGRVAEAGLAVAFHRRHQGIAQEGQVAIDGGTRAAQFFLQPRHGDRIAGGLERAVQGGDAFVAVHASIMSESRADGRDGGVPRHDTACTRDGPGLTRDS